VNLYCPVTPILPCCHRRLWKLSCWLSSYGLARPPRLPRRCSRTSSPDCVLSALLFCGCALAVALLQAYRMQIRAAGLCAFSSTSSRESCPSSSAATTSNLLLSFSCLSALLSRPFPRLLLLRAESADR
jgi:hypothetical protein